MNVGPACGHGGDGGCDDFDNWDGYDDVDDAYGIIWLFSAV